MSIAPIYTSVRIVRLLLVPALKALSGTAGVYWTLAPQGTARPYCIIQSQDQGGISTPRLGSLGWSGLITVKAVADSLSAAETLLAAVAPAMGTLVAPTSYDLSVRFVRPLALPVDADNVWQAGLIFELQLERE